MSLQESDSPCPLVILLSGPSGVGKDAVLSRMKSLNKPYHFTVTATTRPQRPTEQNGVDYIFVSSGDFQQMLDENGLLEWAEVYGNYYGVPKSQVVEALARGHDVIIKIDVQGAATVKGQFPDCVSIFLAPPSVEELDRRLQQRMTESSEALRLRLDTAKSELGEAYRFDYVITNENDQIDKTVEEIESLIARERQRIPARKSRA